MRSMMIVALLGSMALCATLPAVANASPCRDAKGKFIKCVAAPKPKPAKCRDAKGKFMKCAAAH